MSDDTDPVAMAVGDFNNDNRLDVIVANLDSGNIAVLFGNGDGTLTQLNTVTISTYSAPSAVAVGYFNNDNILDIAVADFGSNRISIFIGNGNGTFRSQSLYQTGIGSASSGVAVGDLNHDNHSDVVVANSGTNQVDVFLGYGNGSFRSPMLFSAGAVCVWINVADLNGDGNLDVAVLNQDTNNMGILLGIGNGTFGNQTTYSVGNSNSSYFFAIADANNDDRWDIVIPNTADNNFGILLGKGDGTFGVQTTFSTGDNSQPYGLAVADFNNDNRSDVVVVNYGLNTLGVLLGAC